jgi:hypothetical protein
MNRMVKLRAREEKMYETILGPFFRRDVGASWKFGAGPRLGKVCTAPLLG